MVVVVEGLRGWSWPVSAAWEGEVEGEKVGVSSGSMSSPENEKEKAICMSYEVE